MAKEGKTATDYIRLGLRALDSLEQRMVMSAEHPEGGEVHVTSSIASAFFLRALCEKLMPTELADAKSANSFFSSLKSGG